MATVKNPLLALPGVGPKRAALLEKLGLHTPEDLVRFYPRAYEDRTKLVTVAELEAGVPACFIASVVTNPQSHAIPKPGGRRLELVKVTVADDTARLHLTFFNQGYLAEKLHRGDTYCFYGTLTGDYLGYAMTNPLFEPVEAAGVLTRRILPVYPLTAGLTNSMVLRAQAQAVLRALEAPSGELWLEPSMARALYAHTRTSVSRLEDFARCPYRHFIDYGLRPVERREFTVERRYLGTFYHRAIEGFAREAAACPDWPHITRAQSDEMMDRVLAPLRAEWENAPLGDNAMLRAAGDARFTMVTSMVSMWVFRIGMSYVLGAWLGMGLFGVWTAMQIDWAVRSLVFGVRFLGHKWEKARVLEG